MYLDLCGRRVPCQALESSSFAGFLSSYAPQLLPGRSLRDLPVGGDAVGALPHATTIVAAVCDEGVVLASDRRATAGT
jgi:proteasome beta subunit